MIRIIIKLCCVFMVMSWLISCASTRPLQYMQGSFDTVALAHYDIPEPVIQQNDLLNIVVYSDNPAATAIYNQPLSGSGGGGSSAIVSGGGGTGGAGGGGGAGVTLGSGGSNPTSGGYLVDKAGNIQFQGIGNLHVEGLTKRSLQDTLYNRLKDYLQNPYFSIRFNNYKITVIGDVAHPAVYTIPAEKVSILEALGLAGDMNVTARRNNVLIIREQNGKREFGRIDLTKPDIFNSPFFQLRQNDVVYVDLTKNKAVAADQQTLRTITIATSVITTVALIITIFKR